MTKTDSLVKSRHPVETGILGGAGADGVVLSCDRLQYFCSLKYGNDSKKQISADKAFWLIGGEKMGVKTRRAKWAFQTKQAADNFMAGHGGRPATYEDVIRDERLRE